MRYRVFAVVAAAIVLSVVVATATASSKTAQAKTLTVWLQVDAQNGWPQVVAAANNAFENSHAGWNVNVQYQGWGDHLQKFDATIAADTTPDVIEMGNTEMTKYMAAGAFANITANKGQFDNSGHWLAGLQKSSMFNGKLYGVPYYAGSRLVTYRTDLFKSAGLKKAPKSLKQFESDLAVPTQSGSQSEARAWIADFTNTANEKALQAGGNIPNATNLLNGTVNDRAAKASWFVPTAKHWVDVENGNILRTMLGQILTGRLSVKAAAQTASSNIAYTLNQS